MDVEDLRKLSQTLSSMAVEKQKALKVGYLPPSTTCCLIMAVPPLLPQPAKHKKKGAKASLGSVGKLSKKVDPLGDYQDEDLGAEFDDFM